ncbi:interleukin-7 receptor subunit alpha isoform X2 [Pyxicephalus adspersus]|uniref:interleukin-7 receptor subunit alpha isoform X2 n=1 Tax=Pyxicephalus adspersus TaxID=30357 RepID=UPI003B5C591A
MLQRGLIIASRPSTSTYETGCGKQKEDEPFKVNLGTDTYKVCMKWGRQQNCRNYTVSHIAKPDPPSLSIYYNNELKEYIFEIETPYKGHEYLKNCLIHEAVLRQEDDDWPVCENQTRSHGAYKMCFVTDGTISVPTRNVKYLTKFEAKVRSKPNGEFYDGFWSAWSNTAKFETKSKASDEPIENYYKGEGNVDDFLKAVLLGCCAAGAIFIIIIVLTKMFWKDRIKPFIWPELPDHKNALEKLCISPTKYIHISFNPDFFDSFHINKLDYMKAQVRTEDILPVSATDTEAENLMETNSCNNTSSPAEVSKESSNPLGPTGQCSELSDHLAGNETQAINSLEKPANPENVLSPSSGCSSDCKISNDSSVTLGAGTENCPGFSNVVKPPNNGLKGICWEDISMYIAMSAFKTPNNAEKQPLNI